MLHYCSAVAAYDLIMLMGRRRKIDFRTESAISDHLRMCNCGTREPFQMI